MHDTLAWLGYLLWIAAGLADFFLHRRSDLPHTSGLAESSWHLVQLGLVGVAMAAWWALAPTWTAFGIVAACVLLHAVVGYADTRSAWHRRDIVPAEQHVHSVLDFAPWLFLAWYAWRDMPQGLGLHWQPRPVWYWVALGAPAALVGLMAVMEFRGAWRARRQVLPASGGR